MKMRIYYLILIAISFFTSCQEKIDIEKEKLEIKSIVEKETQAYLDREMDKQFECFFHDKSYTGASKFGISNGWEYVSNIYKELYKNNPEPSLLKIKNDNYTIKVYDKTAWAVYDINYIDENDSLLIGQRQVRFLEKIDGNWKIAFMAHFERDPVDKYE